MSETLAKATIPAIEEFNENESLTFVQFLDNRADGQGRRTFFAYWLANNVGWSMNEHGVRAQIFHTDPAAFVKRENRNGTRVEFMNGASPALNNQCHDCGEVCGEYWCDSCRTDRALADVIVRAVG